MSVSSLGRCGRRSFLLRSRGGLLLGLLASLLGLFGGLGGFLGGLHVGGEDLLRVSGLATFDEDDDHDVRRLVPMDRGAVLLLRGFDFARLTAAGAGSAWAGRGADDFDVALELALLDVELDRLVGALRVRRR